MKSNAAESDLPYSYKTAMQYFKIKKLSSLACTEVVLVKISRKGVGKESRLVQMGEKAI